MGCYMATNPRRASWKRLQLVGFCHKLQVAKMARCLLTPTRLVFINAANIGILSSHDMTLAVLCQC